ncbi:hypothetical protein [Azospirillum sp. TSO5]|uniref:hypothetical protein n=1 Tax=Azospirillum sp. TSO5 TaxID=716760 RepID=UPI000D61535F|nr:hypothetical protein [Azospirillum sp. TSO5]PWC96981.1 hypothetical protein TSO5_06005 [Azospirillum sp. TSO5]
MALTAEQKEANKAARKARDKAWRGRCKLRDAAKAAGEAEIEASEFMARYAEANGKEAIAQQGRDAELERIDREIARLKEERERVAAVWREELAVHRKSASAAWDEKMAADRDLERRLDEQFPDLTGGARYYAASWKPLA